MVNKMLYEDDKDLTMHQGAIHDLSRESGLPENMITEFYEQNLGDLRKTARVKDYLLVITYRMVMESLKYRHL